MSRENKSKIPRDVARLRQRIERWRRTRRKRSPMPEELWQEAARLAQDYGVSPIARQVGVGYASLKERTEQQPASPHQEGEQGNGGEFVELSAAQLFGASPRAAVVELAAQDGLRLTVRLEDGGLVDLVGLLEAFCGRGRS